MLSVAKGSKDDEEELALLQSLRKLRQDSERIAEYTVSLDRVLTGTQRDQVVMANARWVLESREAMLVKMASYYAKYIAALTVGVFSLWRQEASRIHSLKVFVRIDDLWYVILHRFWAWRHCIQQDLWRRELAEGMEGSDELRQRCEQELERMQTQILTTQNAALLDQLKRKMDGSSGTVKKSCWAAWSQIVKVEQDIKKKQDAIVKSMSVMLRANDEQLLQVTFRAFHELQMEGQKVKLREEHRKHMEETAQRNLMRLMGGEVKTLQQLVWRAWQAETRAEKVQRELLKDQENFERSLSIGLANERQIAADFKKTYAEKAIGAMFAGQSDELLMKSYFIEWREEAGRAADYKRREKAQKQIRAISDSERKREQAAEIQAKKMAAMLTGCFLQMSFQGWVCYVNDTQRARRLQIETHQRTITEEIDALRQRAWQFEVSQGLHVLCEWIGKNIAAQKRDALQHWHSKQGPSHHVIASTVVGERDPELLTQRMTSRNEFVQAADEEVLIMERRLAEPVAHSRGLEDRMASIWTAAMQKLHTNRRVVWRVLEDDEADKHDLQEAFAIWKQILYSKQAWRLKVDWKNRARAREEERMEILTKQEEQIRSAAVSRLMAVHKKAVLQEVVDIWRALGAANRDQRERESLLEYGQQRRQSLITNMEGQLQSTLNMRHLKLEGMLIRWSKVEVQDRMKTTLRAWAKVTGITRLRNRFVSHKANLAHLLDVRDTSIVLLRGCLSTWKIEYYYARSLAEIKALEQEHCEHVLVEQRHDEADRILDGIVQHHELMDFCTFFILSWRRLLEERMMDTTTAQITAHYSRQASKDAYRSRAMAMSCNGMHDLAAQKAINQKRVIVWRKVFTAWSQCAQVERVGSDLERRLKAARVAFEAQCRFEGVATSHNREKCVEFEQYGMLLLLANRCFFAWELFVAKRKAKHKNEHDGVKSARLMHDVERMMQFDRGLYHLCVIGWRRTVVESKERWLKNRKVKLESALEQKLGSGAIVRGVSSMGAKSIPKQPLDRSLYNIWQASSSSTPLVNSQTIMSSAASATGDEGIRSTGNELTDNFAARLKRFSFAAVVETAKADSKASSPPAAPKEISSALTGNTWQQLLNRTRVTQVGQPTQPFATPSVAAQPPTILAPGMGAGIPATPVGSGLGTPSIIAQTKTPLSKFQAAVRSVSKR